MCLNGCFAPYPNRTAYKEGETIRITLRSKILLPNKDSYVAIGLPDGALFTLTEKNGFTPFNGKTLEPWQGKDVVVEGITISSDFPRGEYPLYLLRIKKGVKEPLAHHELWELNQGSLKIE